VGRAEEERCRKIQETAVRNKRSVGTETLKSLTNGRGGEGGVAPWM